MDKDNDYVKLLADGQLSKEEKVQKYKEFSSFYEERFSIEKWTSHVQCAEVIEQYITENREKAEILDIGAGTGLVGLEVSLKEAEKKNVYRRLLCQFFTPEPSSIEAKTYDAICISGAFGKGDVDEYSVYEMIRIGKPGCIICFVGRKVAFEKLLPLLATIQDDNMLKIEEVYDTDKYRANTEACVIVCRVL